MLHDGELIKEHVVLRAKAEGLTSFIQLMLDVESTEVGIAGSGWEETGKHGHCCGLPCTVVTEQGRDLTLVHFD